MKSKRFENRKISRWLKFTAVYNRTERKTPAAVTCVGVTERIITVVWRQKCFSTCCTAYISSASDASQVFLDEIIRRQIYETATIQSDSVLLWAGPLLCWRRIQESFFVLYSLLTSQIRLRVGEWDFSSKAERFPHREVPASKKIVHPKYNFFTYEHDLALVSYRYLHYPIIN